MPQLALLLVRHSGVQLISTPRSHACLSREFQSGIYSLPEKGLGA